MDDREPKQDAPRKRRPREDNAEEDLFAIMERLSKKFFPDAEVSAALAAEPMADTDHETSPTPCPVPPALSDASFKSLGAVIARMERPPASTERKRSKRTSTGVARGERPPPITPAHRKLLVTAEAVRLDPDKTEAAFMARQLVQATLPHKNPGDVPLWKRTNGNLTLGIQAGMDIITGKSYGYPYGTVPRLLLFWITTEAVRTKNPRLELGYSLASFMRQLGLNPNNGSPGAKRSDARRLREQMQRLFQAKISFHQTREEQGRKGDAWLNMQIAPEGVLWWDEKQPEQGALWGSWIELSKQFFEAITAAPVPVDMRALRALKRSPLALDLYAWATYTAFQTQKTRQSRGLSWELLHEQMGGEYASIKDFGHKARLALRKVQSVYPDLGLEFEKGGVKVLPCNPAITIKPKQPTPK